MWGSGPGSGLGQAWSWKSEAGQLDIETIFSNEYQLAAFVWYYLYHFHRKTIFVWCVPAV